MRFAIPGALARPLFAIQHVGSCHFVLAGAHERKLDLVLDILDVEGAAIGLAAHERVDDGRSQLFDHLAHTGGSCALAAVDGEERLGDRDGNLARLEGDHGAVAPDDLVLRVALFFLVGGAVFRGVVAGRNRRAEIAA